MISFTKWVVEFIAAEGTMYQFIKKSIKREKNVRKETETVL